MEKMKKKIFIIRLKKLKKLTKNSIYIKIYKNDYIYI
jgi:hypothetical protein